VAGSKEAYMWPKAYRRLQLKRSHVLLHNKVVHPSCIVHSPGLKFQKRICFECLCFVIGFCGKSMVFLWFFCIVDSRMAILTFKLLGFVEMGWIGVVTHMFL
jgi:hypothetical protein